MDLVIYFQFIAALAFVLALIWGLAWLARRSNFARHLVPGASRNTENKRLDVIESLSLDARRRVVLIRQDNREHLLLLSQTGQDLVISADQTARTDSTVKAAVLESRQS